MRERGPVVVGRGRSGVRTRIVWTTAAVTVVAMGLMVLVVVLVVARLTTDRIDASLLDRLAATQSDTARDGHGSLKVARTGAYDVIDTVWVFDAHGTQVSGPDAGARVEDIVNSLSRVTTTTRLQRRDRVYLARPIRLRGEPRPSGVAVASESVRAYEGTQTLLVSGLATLGVLVTALTAAITAGTVRRTLRPVERMTDLAAEWSEHDLEARFDLGERDDELTRLGNTLDGLLDRVAEAIRNEQRLTAELAHELRTPLASIRAEAELGGMTSSDPVMRERLERVVTQVDRLSGTITSLLDLARHHAGSSHRANLGAVITDLVDSRSPTVPVQVDLGKRRVQRVATSADLAERAIAPVLDNALRYAATGVRIEVRRTGRQVVVRIGDDGPGIRTEDREDIFLAGRRDPTAGGAGLGLALSRRIASSVGGSVEVGSPRDPTVVEIRFPSG